MEVKLRPTIVFDCHGVLLDFNSKYSNYVEKTPDWPLGTYDLATVYGDAFVPLDQLPPSFWLGMPLHDDGVALMATIVTLPVTVMLATRSSVPLSGMSVLMQVGMGAVPIVITQDLKANALHNLSHALLIDDCDEEVNAWHGPAVLMPRPWNSAHDKPIISVLEAVAEYISDFAGEGEVDAGAPTT